VVLAGKRAGGARTQFKEKSEANAMHSWQELRNARKHISPICCDPNRELGYRALVNA
jgi:hypothetical protein